MLVTDARSEPDGERLGDLFERAIALPPDERAAMLDTACGDDDELRAELISLLASHAEAPDFLLLHGTHDPLVPPAETEHFVMALAGVSRHRVAYLEILGAGHSFDALHSPRTVATAAAIDRFLRPAPVGFPLGIDRGTRRVRARVYRRRP